MNKVGLYIESSLDYGKTDSSSLINFFPEYPFGENRCPGISRSIYEGVRSLFSLLDLNCADHGTERWNPLSNYIRPGDKVLIKPNLVMDVNHSGCGVGCLYTNPTVLIPIIDYVWIALEGKGSIVVADAPMQSCDFDKLVAESGLDKIVSFYTSQGVNIELKDLRGVKSKVVKGVLSQHSSQNRGTLIDLGKNSSFNNLSDEQINSLRITNYDPSILKSHHNQLHHEYEISNELLESDVVINVPKGKTHRKAGITGALKNMIGVNVRKECLPHHSSGGKQSGHDEYPSDSALRTLSSIISDRKNACLDSDNSALSKALDFCSKGAGYLGKKLKQENESEGSWYGNDTIWRTIHDVNTLVLYADKHGSISPVPQRENIVISDLVIVGEGEGPLLPSEYPMKALLMSDNAFFHDVALSRLFGSDPSLVPSIEHLQDVYDHLNLLSSIRCRSNDNRFQDVQIEKLNENMIYAVKPSSGWKDHLLRNLGE